MSMATADLYYDPYDFEIDADPYPVWKRMRDEQPLYYNEKHDFWAVTRWDDVEAALMLGADGVHLGRDDEGADLAKEHGLMLGVSASNVGEAQDADGRADYIGAGPVWATPSKPDADSAIGLGGLRQICATVKSPVVAIGGIDVTNAADCIRAGAAGVAVIRAARDAAALARSIDEAL